MYPPVLNKPFTVIINSKALKIKSSHHIYLQFLIRLSYVSAKYKQFVCCFYSFNKELFW